jgi:hypothetical protein
MGRGGDRGWGERKINGMGDAEKRRWGSKGWGDKGMGDREIKKQGD